MIRRPLAAALAALAGSLAFAAPALAESADVVDADVALRLADNGELLVTERLTFSYDGHFEGSYRDIPLLHDERIRGVRVSQEGREFEPGGNTALGSFDFDGRFGVEENPGDESAIVRIVWHYRATDETRTTEISYRVDGGAVAYDDVIDVGWAVWGSEWDFDLEHLSASFRDPALDPASEAYRVWGHPREAEGETVRGDGIATLEATDVESGTQVEFRITLPRDPARGTSGMRVVAGPGLAAIVASEGELDDDFNSPLKRVERWTANNVVPASVGLGGLAAIALALFTFRARERDADSVPEHLAEPPDDAGPALAYGLAHEGADSTNTVLATLLDLIDRGYYESSSVTTEEEKLDIAITAAKDRPGGGMLEPYEREVIEFFDQLLDGESVALSEMRDKIPAHSEEWRGRWERMSETLNDAEKDSLSWDLDFGRWRACLALGVAAAFALVTLAYLDLEKEWILPVAIGAATLVAVALYPRNRLRRVSLEHAERCARWRAFERWTEDFPRLADDPPATLDLWKRILVYGVAFGTAERMISSGRIPEPVVTAAATGTHWSGYVLGSSFDNDSFDGSAFSSGFASQVAPVSSSGGGGGFSGGGGGGFSGGGGGGSW